MTCIIGIEGRDWKVYMWWDKISSNGTSSDETTDPKVFRNGELLFGTCGSMRMRNLLQYKLQVPVQANKQKDYKYLVDVVITSIIKTYDEWWFTRKEEDAKKGGHVLIWYRWAVYVLQSDFSVYRSSRWFKALGCWSDYAEWALHLVNYKFDNPRKAIATAIIAAHEFCPGAVSKKCDIISL